MVLFLSSKYFLEGRALAEDVGAEPKDVLLGRGDHRLGPPRHFAPVTVGERTEL
jgi:hypothetical protein